MGETGSGVVGIFLNKQQAQKKLESVCEIDDYDDESDEEDGADWFAHPKYMEWDEGHEKYWIQKFLVVGKVVDGFVWIRKVDVESYCGCGGGGGKVETS